MNNDNLISLLKSPPKVHDWGSGELTATGMPIEVFEFMDSVLSHNSRTIETGLGISTAVFALKGSHHTCITPDSGEITRIKKYLKGKEISFGDIIFICKKSCDVWFDLKNYFGWDLILIDGLHGFPTPFMDWYFFAQGLKINGYVIIDDTHIATGKYLKDFLERDESWNLINSFYGKTAIFQKIKEFDPNKEFINQPFILSETQRINKYKRITDKARKLKFIAHNLTKKFI